MVLLVICVVLFQVMSNTCTSFFFQRCVCVGRYQFLDFLSHLLIAGCDIGVQILVRPFVRAFVHSSICPSTFTSKFDIYVEVFVFSALVVAMSVKPCIVIVLDIPFKHAP